MVTSGIRISRGTIKPATDRQEEYLIALRYIFSGERKYDVWALKSLLQNRVTTSNTIEKFDRKLKSIEKAMIEGKLNGNPEFEKYFKILVRWYTRLYRKFRYQKNGKSMKYYVARLRNIKELNTNKVNLSKKQEVA